MRRCCSDRWPRRRPTRRPGSPGGTGTLAVFAAELVGVRGAELALHLPEQVRDLGAACSPAPAAAGNARRRRPSRSCDISGVQKCSRCSRQASWNICRHSAAGSTDTRSRSRSSQPLTRPGLSPWASLSSPALLAGHQHPQPVAGPHDQRLAVRADGEVADPAQQGPMRELLEIVDIQLPLAAGVVARQS